jgi:hypothetical protein
MSRAAIVIGVNKTTALAELRGAVSDAEEFAEWIELKQGFQTKLLTDKNGGKVSFNAIFEEVKRIVDARTYSQLVIYFSGHGVQNIGSEIWLLSGAPENSREAIGLEPSIMAARESGLTNVVFISDACRSIPDTMELNHIDGGSIFPNKSPNRTTRPDVDRFFATLPSSVAIESVKAGDAARRGGVFTNKFIGVHHDTPLQHVMCKEENGEAIEVVTNREVKKFVRELVEDAVHEIAPQASQLPDAILESLDAYTGRVERTAPVDRPDRRIILHSELEGRMAIEVDSPENFERPQRPSVSGIAQEVVASALSEKQSPLLSQDAQALDKEAGLSSAIERYLAPIRMDHFETRTGFSVIGAKIRDVLSSKFAVVQLPDGFKLGPENPIETKKAASVLIRFEDGSGTVVPGLEGYLGYIFVENGVVVNVNYVPSSNSRRWPGYQDKKVEIERLRASVAAAAKLGVFQVSPNSGGEFGNRIRQMKAIDPTLGLYAAYAYASAGLIDQIASVAMLMRDDLSAELFDVAMLERMDVDARKQSQIPIVPFCPMLRQGWSFLEQRKTQLSDIVRQARQWVRPGLWTTFAPEGMSRLIDAFKKGNLP